MLERLIERVQRLERFNESLQSEIDSLKLRVGASSGTKQLRIAEVMDPPSEGNTAHIRFVDGKFAEFAGSQTPSWRPRQVAARKVVHNLAGEKIPVGKRVPAFQWNDRWWTWFTKGSDQQPTGDMIWQYFDDEDGYWYRGLSDEPRSDNSVLLYGGGPSDRALVEFQSAPSIGSAQLVTMEFGYDAAMEGNLRLVDPAAQYLFMVKANFVTFRQSMATEFPDPPVTLVGEIRINRHADDGTLKGTRSIVGTTCITDGTSFSSSLYGYQWQTAGWYIDGDWTGDNDPRKFTIEVFDQATIADLGFRVEGVRFLLVKLPNSVQIESSAE